MSKFFFFSCICLFALVQLNAQKTDLIPQSDLEQLKAYEDTLGLMAYAIVNDSLPEHRFGAVKKMIPTLVKALKINNSFDYPFDQLMTVSIQYPQDSSFRVFTWQLYVDVNEYRYYGAIQMNQPELKLYPLVDRSFKVENVEQELLSPDNWYGAVYYNLKEVETPAGENYYLLFGFDGFEFFKKRKVVEVLSFDEGKPVFGAPVFYSKEEGWTKNRILREYSAEVSTRLNYDEVFELIMFDHLITLNGQHGEGPVNFPDGSYEGFLLEKGLWVHRPKVFDQTSEEAPRPEPVLDSRGKDIFGKNR